MLRKRPLIAVALAFVYPGLGHAYLKRWLRALLWFGLVVSAVVFVIPDSAIEGSESVLGTVQAVSEQLSLGESLALVSILVFNMIDAYVLAEHTDRQARRDEVVTCPQCGQELDEDLDFCHWCTTRFDTPNDEETV